jgi:hypothetical protein
VWRPKIVAALSRFGYTPHKAGWLQKQPAKMPDSRRDAASSSGGSIDCGKTAGGASAKIGEAI